MRETGRMLLFKSRFFPAIRQGRKRQTIRFWRRRIVRPGQIHRVPGLGYLRVLQVEEIRPEGLTGEDAAADGFSSVEALREELGRLYDRARRRGRRCYRVRFEYLGPARPASPPG